MKSVGPSPAHTCRYSNPYYAICEEMAVIVHWECTEQAGSVATDYERDETYFCPSEPPCENTQHRRFELQYTVYRGKQCDGNWTEWCAGRDDAYSKLEGIEFEPMVYEHVDSPHVTECDVGETPTCTHGQISLETQTEHGHIKAVYEGENQ